MADRSRREAIVLLGAGAFGTAVVGACSGDDDAAAPASSSTSEESSQDPPTTARPTTTTASPDITVVARAEVDVIDVFDDASSTEPNRRLDRTEETTGNLVFVVTDEATAPDGRHRVQLPVRPNGSTGWVRAQDVSLTQHDFRLQVELSAHRLRVFKAGAVIVEAPIGVGTTDTPTPGGVYYVKELLQPPDPNGVYGTYAYGLSGFSNVLESFAGGEGVIGIHGTNAPERLGSDVSAGCIRLDNQVINRFVEEIGLPLGVPVEINA